MTVIGVTDEPATKIKPFIQKRNLNYLIAIGGAPGYRTRGIPHAWLVSPKSEIVWHGHPASLKESMIEEQLRSVRLVPTFKLPKSLSSAQTKLNRGKFAAGLKALERFLKRARADPAETSAARDAIKQVSDYGKGKLVEVEEYAKAGYYADAINALTMLETAFKGTKIGDIAKAKKKAWRKDPAIKAEILASQTFDQAIGFLDSGKPKPAVKLLFQITRSKKFKNTKVRKKALAKLGSLGYR